MRLLQTLMPGWSVPKSFIEEVADLRRASFRPIRGRRTSLKSGDQ
jgi:hypothetical protein